jgi:hypothetical protein
LAGPADCLHSFIPLVHRACADSGIAAMIAPAKAAIVRSHTVESDMFNSFNS